MRKVIQDSRNVITVYYEGISQGWEAWALLGADRHHDNVYCNRNLEKAHLKLAEERDALIFDFGDLFCAMQGKYDPRANMDDIRPEDVGRDYLDRIVSHAAEFYGPYAKNFALIGKGNHETSILSKHGIDLTSNLCHRLNADYGGNVYSGYYGGWVRFLFRANKTHRSSKNMKYHHGAGGGGPVTRGVIQTNRQAVYLPDADIVVNGHTHDSWIVPIARERLSNRGKIYKDLCYFVRTPGYKDEYDDGAEGFHNERWAAPKPIGAVWLRFYYDRQNRRISMELTQDLKMG